jgi:hypothetical protein
MTVRFRRLTVDFRAGVQSDEWDDVLDSIIRVIKEAPNVRTVRLKIPAEYETGQRGRLLDALVHVLTGRGISVERRYVSG